MPAQVAEAACCQVGCMTAGTGSRLHGGHTPHLPFSSSAEAVCNFALLGNPGTALPEQQRVDPA